MKCVSACSYPLSLVISTEYNDCTECPVFSGSISYRRRYIATLQYNMSANGMASVNGNGTPDQSSRLDPNFTKHVIETMGPNITSRNRQIMTSLIRHLHDFTREIELTNDEWMTGVHFINSLGQNSTGISNETFRLCEILGLESYALRITTANKGDRLTNEFAV